MEARLRDTKLAEVLRLALSLAQGILGVVTAGCVRSPDIPRTRPA